ncbi:HEAT repeat domain-containing protein [Candidatus Poribacteria bacterium]
MLRAVIRIVAYLSVCIVLTITFLACSDGQKTEYRIGAIPTDELVQLIHNKTWTTQYLVANVAAERGIEALPSLLNMVDYTDESVQRGIWMTVAKLEDPDSMQLVLEFLESRGWQDMRGLSILREFGSQRVEPLLRALEQTTSHRRARVIEILGGSSDPRAGEGLLKIVSNRDDPNWDFVTIMLAKRRDEAGHILLGLAESDPDVWQVVSKYLEPTDGKWLLPLYFRQVKSEDETMQRPGLMGIARNAGKAELSRIESELNESDQAWVRPFVEINRAVEGVESESEKAEILWQFILDTQYYIHSSYPGYPLYGPYSESDIYLEYVFRSHLLVRPPGSYATERLAELGDVILPLLREGLKSVKDETRLRSLIALTDMPPSKASTKLLLEAWDDVERGSRNAHELRILDRIAEEFGDRGEKKAIPRIFELLYEVKNNPPGYLDFYPEGALKALEKLGDRKLASRVMKLWREVGTSAPGSDVMIRRLAKIMNHWKVSDPSVIPLLVNAMSVYESNDGPYGPFYPNRFAAVMILVRIGEPAIETLRKQMEIDRVFHEENPRKVLNADLAGTALEILGQPVIPGRAGGYNGQME